MSLINDALKKAQKQRTGESPPLASLPSVGGETPQRIARRAKPAGFDTLMVRAGIGGAVVLVLAVGGFFLLSDKPSAGGPVSAPAVSAPTSSNVGSPLAVPFVASREGAAGAPSTAGTPPQQPTTSSQQPQVTPPTFTLPTAPKTEPVVAKSEPPKTTATASPPVAKPQDEPRRNSPSEGGRSQVSLPGAQAPDPKPQTPVSVPPAKLAPHAIEYIENIKVAGIRASATDAKVLMNDRVYRVGSMVSADFGLKLVDISPNALTFEDDRGVRYTRTF